MARRMGGEETISETSSQAETGYEGEAMCGGYSQEEAMEAKERIRVEV